MALPNLRAEMARSGVTQKDLSDKTGVSERTITSWFNGETAPRIDAAFIIRDEFFECCTVDYLFAGSSTAYAVVDF